MKKINLCLMILDGLGKGENNLSNPFRFVKKNIFEDLKKRYPYTLLQASGFSVGLSPNDPGNCEQGHLTLGTGRINYTPKIRVDLAIEKGELKENPVIKEIVNFYFENNSNIHLLLTLSEKPVESDINHLYSLLDILRFYQINKRIYLHFFLESTFSTPKSSLKLLKEVLKELEIRKIDAKIATLIGSFYALDTSKNYVLRTQRAFLALVSGIGRKYKDLETFIKEKENDENFKEDMLEPTLVLENAYVKDNDIVIFLNYEPQGVKELALAFFDPNFNEFTRPLKKNLFLISLVDYFDNLPHTVIFPKEKIEINLSRAISEAKLRQFKITDETRKKHLTYYFNGLIEEEHINEVIKILPGIDSEENAYKITEEIFNYLKLVIKEKNFHFVAVNFSIFDFFGHLGDFNKGVKAIEFMSEKIEEFLEIVKKEDWYLMITSDHGNIEKMLDVQRGIKDTFHNKSPVPFYLIHKSLEKERIPSEEVLGSLVDVMPTILDLYGILENYKNFIEGKSLLNLLQ
ncbi:MAG: sulfatase-like hydrolase/transferase [Candidatus Pacebacteria bacterium]|nr:sulfatase-like hydrolase/transferase [Candidatus Paceibacterota bacterium]